jgi:hypothetical protein
MLPIFPRTFFFSNPGRLPWAVYLFTARLPGARAGELCGKKVPARTRTGDLAAKAR